MADLKFIWLKGQRTLKIEINNNQDTIEKISKIYLIKPDDLFKNIYSNPNNKNIRNSWKDKAILILLNDAKIKAAEYGGGYYVKGENGVTHLLMQSDKAESIIEKWPNHRIFGKLYKITNEWKGWKLTPNKFFYVYIDKKIIPKAQRVEKIKIKKDNFNKISQELKKIHSNFLKDRKDSNKKVEEYRKKNMRKQRIARTIDIWLNPNHERNKDIMKNMSEEKKKEIIDEYKDLRKELSDVNEPWNDCKIFENEIIQLSKKSEDKANEVIKAIEENKEELCKCGRDDDIVVLMRELMEGLALTEAGKKYFNDEIIPTLIGAKSNPLWIKMFDVIPENPPEKTWEKNYEETKDYYNITVNGLKLLDSFASVIAEHKKNIEILKKFSENKRLGWIVKPITKEVVLKSIGKTVKVKQLTLDGYATKVKWQGRMENVNKWMMPVNSLFSSINVAMALVEFSEKGDADTFIALVDALAGLGEATINLSDDVTEKMRVMGKTLGFIGGAASTYSGIKGFYTNMDLMEPEKGFCDLLLAAGGMCTIGGVGFALATGGTSLFLAVVGGLFTLVGGIGKWIFSDSDHMQYLKGTKYYVNWDQAQQYYIVKFEWGYYMIQKEIPWDDLVNKKFELGVKFYVELAGVHDTLLYGRLYETTLMDDIVIGTKPKPLSSSGEYEGAFNVNVKNGIATIYLEGPFKIDGKTADTNKEFEVYMKLYNKSGDDLKEIGISNKYSSMPGSGRIKPSK